MNEPNEIHCEGNNLSLEVNYIPQMLVPTMCKRSISWIKGNNTPSRMVMEESLLRHRFEARTCASLAEGEQSRGLGCWCRVCVCVCGGRVGGERMLHGNELIQNFTIRKNEETGHLNFQPTWKFCVVWDHDLSSPGEPGTFHLSPAGNSCTLAVSCRH